LYSFRVTMTVNEFYYGLPEAREDPTLGELGSIGATIPHLPADASQKEAVAQAILEYEGEVAKFYHRRANEIIFKGICKILFLNGLNTNIRMTTKVQRRISWKMLSRLLSTQSRPLDKTVQHSY